MTVRQVLKQLKEEGWYIARHRKSSHRQLKHPTKKGLITISGKESDVLKKGTLGNIWRQAGLK